MSDPATFVEVDERPAVRFVRRWALPAAQVWTAVATPEGLRGWFPSPEVTYEPTVGAVITFAGDPHLPTFQGRVLTWEPQRLFGFAWGTDEVRLELESDGPDTVLTLTDILEEPGAAARNAAGWEACLQALDDELSGGAHARPDDEREAEIWREAYDRYVASGFPSGSPVPGL